MVGEQLTYRGYFTRELARRCAKNPQYSLRAFARDLGIVPSQLSEVLRGQTGLSNRTAEEMCNKLGLNTRESEHFRLMVAVEHSRSLHQKKIAQERYQDFMASNSFEWIEAEQFKMISEWYHCAILELTELISFRPDPKWIAKRLSITQTQSEIAIQRLFHYGLLKQEGLSWVQTKRFFSSQSAKSSSHFKTHHACLLRKAVRSLSTTAVNRRDSSSVTMAIASEDLSKLKELLAQFRKSFIRAGDEGDEKMKKDHVYCLSMHFFPVDALDSHLTNEEKGLR